MFSENDRRNALLGGLTIIVMVAVCAASVFLYKLAVPEHVDADTMTASYSDYEQAFLKWQESEIDNYEITLRGGDDDVILRVADAGTSVEVVQHFYKGEPIDDTDMDEYSAELRNMSVEHMFDVLQITLAQYEAGDLPRSLDESYTFFYDLTARFDPALGYPVYMGEHKRIIRPSREVTLREVYWIPVEVKDFKVLDAR